MTLQPSYYSKFKCIANKCKDNCCIGWEINVDKDSYEYYMSIKSDFSKQLHNGILKKDDEYSFRLGKQKRCVFLNENNLCDIICNLGEKSLCQICSDHPRYYNFYKDVQENGLGLACEEACRIILTEENPINFINSVTGEICNRYTTDDIYLNFLLSVREILLNTLHIKDYSIAVRLAVIVKLCDIIQNLVDSSCTDLELFESVDKLSNTSQQLLQIYKEQHKTEQNIDTIIDIIKDFTTLEILDAKWLEILKEAVNKFSHFNLNKKTTSLNTNIEKMFENLSVYFVQRYFMETYFNNQIYEFGIFIAVCFILIRYLMQITCAKITTESVIDLIHSFSKEIEYSDCNIDSLYKLFVSSDIYSIDSLIDILLI